MKSLLSANCVKGCQVSALIIPLGCEVCKCGASEAQRCKPSVQGHTADVRICPESWGEEVLGHTHVYKSLKDPSSHWQLKGGLGHMACLPEFLTEKLRSKYTGNLGTMAIFWRAKLKTSRPSAQTVWPSDFFFWIFLLNFIPLFFARYRIHGRKEKKICSGTR